jgi:3-phosphoglycerate kinase
MSDDTVLERVAADFAGGDTKRRIERELRAAVFYLENGKRGLFGRARFDYATKRIISACGKHALQWHNSHNRRGKVSYVEL